MIWTIAWLAWIAGFAALEGAALFSKTPGATLSAHVWKWFRIRDKRPTAATWAGRAVLLIGGIWLTGHLALGIWSL